MTMSPTSMSLTIGPVGKELIISKLLYHGNTGDVLPYGFPVSPVNPVHDMFWHIEIHCHSRNCVLSMNHVFPIDKECFPHSLKRWNLYFFL